MKKNYLLSSIFVFTLILPAISFAEVSPTRVNKIDQLKQKVLEEKQKAAEDRIKIKTEITSTTTIIKNSIEVRIGKKLDDKKLKVAVAFEKSIQNLKDLIARIESRIAKMKLLNIDISSPELLLETAKTNLSLAETELKSLENTLSENLPLVSTSTASNKIRKKLLNKIKLES